MKFINFLLFIVLICPPSLAYSQSDDKPKEDLSKLSFKQRLKFNIGGGLALGNNYSNISILPQVGYRVTPKFTAGIGGNFQYFKNTFYSTNPFLIYGGNVFGRYNLNPMLFAQAEYQMLNFNDYWGQYSMVGGGYMPGGGFYISAYYLLLYPSQNVYGSPLILRGGFMF